MIKRIVEDLNMDVAIEVQSTIREEDGLAMSSRNAYLSNEERAAAPIVYKSLCVATSLFGELKTETDSISASCIEDAVRAKLSEQPLVSSIQYVSVDSLQTMTPLSSVTKSCGAVVSLACKIGSVRLIDNVILQ